MKIRRRLAADKSAIVYDFYLPNTTWKSEALRETRFYSCAPAVPLEGLEILKEEFVRDKGLQAKIMDLMIEQSALEVANLDKQTTKPEEAGSKNKPRR